MSSEVRPGYKQTEEGVIPEDWEVNPIGYFINYTKGYAFRSSDYKRDGVRIIRVSDTSFDSIKNDSQFFISENESEKYSKWKLNEFDIIISTVGSKPPMYDSMVGKAVLVDKCAAGALLNQNAVLIRNNEKHPLKQILLLCNLRTKRYFSFIEGIFRGNANQASITLKDLFEFSIPLPSSTEEQNAISHAISDIDSLISSLDQLIAKKRDIQQAAMQQLLTGQRRLPGFSGEWQEGTLCDVVRSLEAGVSVNSTDDLPEPGLPCVLKTSALSGGSFLPNEAKVITAADRERACTNPKRNTILISRMNTPALVGEIAYVEKDFNWLFLPDRLWMTQFISDDCVNAQWLAYLLSSRPYRRLLQDSAAGTSGSMKNISKAALLNVQISFPEIEEQTAIANILFDMATELVVLETRRDKARQLKQGMMQELLTGRIRLV